MRGWRKKLNSSHSCTAVSEAYTHEVSSSPTDIRLDISDHVLMLGVIRAAATFGTLELCIVWLSFDLVLVFRPCLVVVLGCCSTTPHCLHHGPQTRKTTPKYTIITVSFITESWKMQSWGFSCCWCDVSTLPSRINPLDPNPLYSCL